MSLITSEDLVSKIISKYASRASHTEVIEYGSKLIDDYIETKINQLKELKELKAGNTSKEALT